MSTRPLIRLLLTVGLGAVALVGCGDTKITLAVPTSAAATTVASTTPVTAAAATTNAPAVATTTAPSAAATTKAPPVVASTEPPITVDPNKPGNAYIQNPFEGLVSDCRSGDAGSCNELDERVARQAGPGEGGPLTSTPLCYFYYQWQSQPDAFVLGYLTKAWATMQPGPAGVTAGLATLATDPNNTQATDSVEGYIGGICPGGD